MKPDEQKLRALLDDVLPPTAGQCGPDCTRVLEMARQNRSRRRARTALATTAAALGIVSLFALRSRPASSPASFATAVEPAPLVIHSIDDAQLFTLLKGTPTAIMEWPNGDRTLFFMER
jgi:hypothetical protein